MLSAENDFAEMISVPLTNLNTQIEIAKKEAFITDYFNKKVGFSLKRLQLLSLQRLNRFNNR